jgi:hypothetical protein
VLLSIEPYVFPCANSCSRGSSCMDSRSVVWGGLVVSRGGDWGCGGDGRCSVMMVYGGVSG